MKPSRRLLIVVLIGAAVAVLADVLLRGDAEAQVWGSGIPGYWAVFGLVWTVVLAVASKWLGRLLLHRREDFYDEGDSDG